MKRWLPFDLGRRGFLGAGLLAAGGAALSSQTASGQTAHPAGHGAASPATGDVAVPAHRMAHGAMITAGDVDDTDALSSLTREVADVMAQAHAVDGSCVRGARPLAPTLTAYLESSVAALIAHGYELPGRWREAARHVRAALRGLAADGTHG